MSADTDEGPRRISNREINIDLAGYLCPFETETQPLLLNMPGTDDLFFAVFSTEPKLRSFLAAYRLSCSKIVQIADSRVFLDSVLGQVRVCVDPYRHENGRLRYLEPLPSTRA